MVVNYKIFLICFAVLMSLSFVSAIKWTAVNSIGNFTFDGVIIGENTAKIGYDLSTNLAQETIGCINGKCANMTLFSQSNYSYQTFQNMTQGTICFWFNPKNNIVLEGNKVIAQADSSGFDLGDFDISLGDFGIWGGIIGNLYFKTQTNVSSYIIGYNLTNANVDVWQHLCAKINATGSYMYLNGSLVNKTIQSGLQLFNEGIEIGGVFPLLGYGRLIGIVGFSPSWWIDEFKVFNISLTDIQILDMYNLETSRSQENSQTFNSTTY